MRTNLARPRISMRMRKRINGRASTGFELIRAARRQDGDRPIDRHWAASSSPVAYSSRRVTARISRVHGRINISPPRGRPSGGIARREWGASEQRAAIKVTRTPSGFGSSRADCCYWLLLLLSLLLLLVIRRRIFSLKKTRVSLERGACSLIPCPDDHPAAWLPTLCPQRAEGHGTRWPARKMIRSVVIGISLIHIGLESFVGDFFPWEKMARQFSSL